MKLEIVGWKGKSSVRAYVPKNDRIHYLRLIGGDTSKYEKNKFEAKREEGWKPWEETHQHGAGEETLNFSKEIKNDATVADTDRNDTDVKNGCVANAGANNGAEVKTEMKSPIM